MRDEYGADIRRKALLANLLAAQLEVEAEANIPLLELLSDARVEILRLQAENGQLSQNIDYMELKLGEIG